MKLRLACLVVLSFTFVSGSVFGQAIEVSPYAGFYWPGDNGEVGKLQSNQVLGLRGGAYISPNAELGLNYAWSNHFQPSHTNEPAAFAGNLGFQQGKVRSKVLEAEFTYHFGSRRLLGSSVRPYVAIGAGRLKALVNNDEEFVLNVRPFTKPCGCIGYVANDVLQDGDKFFTFSYGAGLKATRVWGPMGFFGDFRGRTIPNFFGHGMNWPELSAGVNFSWGER